MMLKQAHYVLGPLGIWRQYTLHLQILLKPIYTVTNWPTLNGDLLQHKVLESVQIIIQ